MKKQPNPKVKVIVSSVMAAIFVPMSLVALWWTSNFCIEYNAAQSWPTVKGAIVKKWQGSEENRDPQYHGSGIWVRYEYVVADCKFTSERASFINQASRNSRYKVGESVAVYYNPEKPNRSVLNPRGILMKQVLLWAIPFFGVFFLGSIYHLSRVVKLSNGTWRGR